jgi:hypothetical protein
VALFTGSSTHAQLFSVAHGDLVDSFSEGVVAAREKTRIADFFVTFLHFILSVRDWPTDRKTKAAYGPGHEGADSGYSKDTSQPKLLPLTMSSLHATMQATAHCSANHISQSS